MKSLPMLESERLLGTIRWHQLFDMDEQIQVQMARLESDVHHIHTDVADIKVDLRRTNDKLDAMSLRISGVDEKLTGKIEALDEKLTGKMEALDEKLTGKMEALDEKLTGKMEALDEKLTGKIEALDEKLTGKIEALDEKLTGKIEAKIDGVRSEVGDLRREITSMKIWAMGMYVALAGSLLFVMAKGFKWL